MALVASLFASLVAVSAAASIYPEYDNFGDIPVRRSPKKFGETPTASYEPASLEEAVWATLQEVPVDNEPMPVSLEEDLSVTALHKDWPHCQTLRDHNWGGMQGAAQHLHKMGMVPNVSSAQACGNLCGSYTYKHDGADVPCAGFAYVEKAWAQEFGGHKSCAMFGFLQNEHGVVRFPVSEYTFKNSCCTAGTPCKDKEAITEYQVSTDRVAAAYRKAERGRRGREKKARIAAARAAKIEAAKPYPPSHKVAFAVIPVITLAVLIALYASMSSNVKQ